MICSSDRDRTNPAACICLRLSMLRPSGLADTTSGFFSSIPRYVVERSGVCIAVPSSVFVLSKLRVLSIALAHVTFGELQQPLRLFWPTLRKHAIAGLGVQILLEWNAWCLRVKCER